MNVFISWSGTRSREVAVSLKQWIPALLPTSEPWIASDLPTGSNWSREITHRLQQAHTGIICLTEENRNSPWLLFEAGALARAGKLFLYLIDFDAAELAGPLAQFQATRANEEGTWKLILALNSATEQQAPENELQDRFNRRWPQLRDSLAATRAPGVETLSLVFGDVVGSTRLVATAGDLSVQKIFGDLFARASEFNRSNRGQSLKFLGDGFLAAFRSPSEAFMFASELQRSLSEKPLLISGTPLTIRMGVHCGDVQRISEEDIVGMAVSLAARITSLANPGQIVISEVALAQLPGESRKELTPIEQVQVKGFANRVAFSRYNPAPVR
jgi:class 3 adenylate cyclase